MSQAENLHPHRPWHQAEYAVQVYTYAMDWYVEQRQRLEDEIQKYSDPPSEQLLPELPPHARYERYLQQARFPEEYTTQASTASIPIALVNALSKCMISTRLCSS